MKNIFALLSLILLPAGLFAQLSVSITSTTNVNCNSTCDGTATSVGTGGILPYTYVWYPGPIVGQNPTTLCAGFYTLVVTDNIGSTATATCQIVQPTALTLAVAPGPVTVCVGSNITFTGTVTGGTGPYIFNWTFPGGSPSSSTMQNPTVSYSTAGSYTATCTVTDAAGCVAMNMSSVTVSPTTVGGTVAGSSTFCSTTNSGTFTLSGHTGNVIRWEFSTDGGLTWTNVSNTTTTMAYANISQDRLYRARVQSGACTVAYSTNASITILSAPIVSVSVGTSIICQGDPVTLTASGAVAYTWLPGNLTSSSIVVNPISSTTYTVTGVAANGCTDSETITITVNSLPTVVMSGVNPTCNNADGSATATATGNAPFAYNWMPAGGPNATATGLAAGTYFCMVTDVNGCSVTPSIMLLDSCDYVWPGDANDDAVADNIDILDIGIANGATGTTRASATTSWTGQPSVAWGTTLLSGTDYKWVDCDGNGAINPVDTQAVILNYGMTHNNRYIAPTYSAVAPDLSISFDQDSVGSGSTGTLTLALGNSTTQAVGVYGLAFRLNYDAAQIATSSIGLIGGTSWFGTPGNDMMRVVLHPNAAMGYVDVAITRLDHQNMSGFGTIAQIYFTATLAMAGTGNAADVPMTLSNIVLIDTAEVAQAVNSIGDTVVVADDAIITSVVANESASSSVYPNPANESINFTIAGTERQLVTIEDVTGRVVYSQYHNAGANAITVASLPAGAYVLRVTDNKGVSTIDNITIAH